MDKMKRYRKAARRFGWKVSKDKKGFKILMGFMCAEYVKTWRAACRYSGLSPDQIRKPKT